MEASSPVLQRQRRRARRLALVLSILLVICALATLRYGVSTQVDSFDEVLRGWAAVHGLAEPLPDRRQDILDLRWRRVLVTVAVGSSLALSGALLQGVFRNPLAAPSVLGLTAGANLGASVAILLMAGHGPSLLLQNIDAVSPLWTTSFALVGAVGTAFLVVGIASRGGQVSVATLLLVGVAVNTCLAGILATIQSLSLRDIDLARAIFQWTFGMLSDRSWQHVGLAFAGLAMAASAIPLVARELDLFAAGEDDAATLGVPVRRVKLIAVGAAALAASAAVSVAGQIAFVGLVVPHLVRLLVGTAHRHVLPLCLLGGAVLLLGTDTLQRWLLPDSDLQPGVVMSLVGGPFFLALLLGQRGAVRSF